MDVRKGGGLVPVLVATQFVTVPDATESPGNEDRPKAPASPNPSPCPYRRGGLPLCYSVFKRFDHLEVNMAHISLAVLGGSSVATPALVQALLDWAGHAHDRPALRLVLLGRSARKLAQVRAVCERMVREAQPGITIEASTDLRAGLWRVDYILNQMRVGGLKARA